MAFLHGVTKATDFSRTKTNTIGTHNNMQPVYFPYCTVVQKVGQFEVNLYLPYLTEVSCLVRG